MAHDPDDHDLRRAFTSLRESDSVREGPSFDAMWARAAAARSARSNHPVRWVVAAAAIAAVMVVVVSREPVRPSLVDVGSWQSPTAVLLRVPGDALLRDVPTLGSSSVSLFVNPLVPGGIP